MRIKLLDTLFVMIDIQDKFEAVINDIDEVIKNADILNKASSYLNIPLIITEQYPKGLGTTIQKISIPEHAMKFEKMSFSIFNKDISDYIENQKKKTLVFYGIEAHICLYQSTIDALEKGYKVYFVSDAVSSRKLSNKKTAISRLLSKGAQIVSTEMLLFELMENSTHPEFKQISALVK